MVGGTTKLFLREEVCNGLKRLCTNERGNTAVIFALALVPLMTGLGAAVDYSRANATKEAVQAALDSALLAGAKDGSATWKAIAADVFNSNLALRAFSAPTPDFTKTDDVLYAGSVTASIPTALLGIVGIKSMGVTAQGQATAAEADNSCILTLDKGQPKSHVSLSLNGAPVVNLSGCSIRSNTSLDCNGHDGNLTKSYGSGSVAGCSRPRSNAPVVPDTYADLAKHITTVCAAGLGPGAIWTAGEIPMGAGIKTVTKSGYIEYHICGDLLVSGSGYLTSSAPATDIVIIIENGSLIVDDKASISTARTAIVLTGDNTLPAKIVFPKGAGKQGTLSLSPPTSVGNPWQAVSLYLDPKLTKDVNNTWGPGASFIADGLVYLGNSNVATDGNTTSANSKCTKFVMNSFATNGAVRLDFAQQNCAALGLKQWDGIVVHLVR